MTDQEIRDTIRSMMADWAALPPERQREEMEAAAARAEARMWARHFDESSR